MNIWKQINFSASWEEWSWLSTRQLGVSSSVESTISDPNKLLEESLAKFDWDWRRQLQKLRFAWFVEVDSQIAEKAGFKRYLWNEKIAVYKIWKEGRLILWWDTYLVDDVDTIYLENRSFNIECVSFIISNEGRYYLYKHDWNGSVKIVPNFISDDWAFFTKEAVESEAEEVLVWKWLDYETSFQDKKLRLLKLGYQPIQKQTITELTHYIKKLPNWKIYEILIDEYHENIVAFWGRSVHEEIKVFSQLRWDNTRVLQWILVKSNGRIYFYVFWEQYRSTKIPLMRYNPDSDDGWFSNKEEFHEAIEAGKLAPKSIN